MGRFEMFDGFGAGFASLFAHPAAAVAGGLLVAVPVVIHLINRLRYKRVRFAAMEFLLAAQKRVKRKLVVQQMLLLAMRCLAVLLLGLLAARFLGLRLLEPESRSTLHVVILDDSPSMGDPSDAPGAVSALGAGRQALTGAVLRNAADATTPQRVEVYRLSDLGKPDIIERLNRAQLDEFAGRSERSGPAAVRVPLLSGLRAASRAFELQGGDVARVLHVVSDFRAADLAESPQALAEAFAQLASAKVQVHLIDAASPARRDGEAAPPSHDNLSIVEFSPAKLVAARYDPVEFTLRVRNNGAADVRSVRFAVKVNGDENKGRSVAFESIPAFSERAVKLEVTLDRLGTPELPFDRFSLVTAALESPEPGGLAVDNSREAVVEVREKLGVVAIEGRGPASGTKQGETTYLKPVFTSVLTGYAWAPATPKDLETTDLSTAAVVLLLNVPALTPQAVENLERYAKGGGGVGFFLGPEVRPQDYTDGLYRAGAGVFPVPLAREPSRQLTDEEVQARRFRITQKKLLMRDPALRSHPAVAGLYTDERGQPVADADQLERVFGFISIKRYWPVPKLGAWRGDRDLAELYALPNEQSMADYESPARKLADALADALPVDVPEAARYKELLSGARSELRRVVLTSDPLYKLAAVLDELLGEERGAGEAGAALAREFWADPRRADLRAEVVRLRDAVKFGDPFYLARSYGRGRVTLVTTTAGELWSDWPSERPGSATFAPMMKEMATYLTGAGAGENRLVGTPIEFRTTPTRAGNSARKALQTSATGRGGADPAPRADLGELPLVSDGGGLVLRDPDTASVGAYLYALAPGPAVGTGPAPVGEFRAEALNVDATREGDLRRASRDDIAAAMPGAKLHSASENDWSRSLRSRPQDLSESWYFVVAIGLLLLAEQALATRLSFHAPSSIGRTP